jgi:alpha-beta hydrolase superfamily lysophospholipase
VRRDAIPLETDVAPATRTRVERRAFYFEDGSAHFRGDAAGAMFAWYHSAPGVEPRDCVAVLCAPLGHEHTRAHRTLRHLADRLALAGIPALRFDYHGIGDSPGGDLDPGRVPAWQASIRTAIRQAQLLAGRTRVCVIGVRLGATLAALAAVDTPVDYLVLWNPCVRMASYLRELQAIAATAERAATDIQGALESAGFVMSAETLAGLRAIDLLSLEFKVKSRVLCIGRNDTAPDHKLCEHIAASGIATDTVRLPGWADMMAEHQFTVVPDKALDTIVEWLAAHSDTGPAASPLPSSLFRDSVAFAFRGESGVAAVVEEQLCRFGADEHLFGILSRTSHSTERPAILIFNAGSVHHVGPNRVSVTLARNLAAWGFACLRFDHEGIGDSVRRGDGRENHPYPATAVDDVRAAIECLRHRFGYTRFVAMGLCSGAHTAFHAGLTLGEDGLDHLVLINPLTFYWVEGDSIETTRRFEDAAAYRKSMRDPGRWLKLARGDVNLPRLFEVAAAQARSITRSYWQMLQEMLMPAAAPRLSRDLGRLLESKRRIAFFISEGDPGRDILMAGARWTATRALRDGRIRLETIPDADHTFSQWKPRCDLMCRVTQHLRESCG